MIPTVVPQVAAAMPNVGFQVQQLHQPLIHHHGTLKVNLRAFDFQKQGNGRTFTEDLLVMNGKTNQFISYNCFNKQYCVTGHDNLSQLQTVADLKMHIINNYGPGPNHHEHWNELPPNQKLKFYQLRLAHMNVHGIIDEPQSLIIPDDTLISHVLNHSGISPQWKEIVVTLHPIHRILRVDTSMVNAINHPIEYDMFSILINGMTMDMLTKNVMDNLQMKAEPGNQCEIGIRHIVPGQKFFRFEHLLGYARVQEVVSFSQQKWIVEQFHNINYGPGVPPGVILISTFDLVLVPKAALRGLF